MHCKQVIFTIFFILSAFLISAQTINLKLKTGDLMFVESISGNMNDAIKGATSDSTRSYTHVGIVCFENDVCYIIEATPPIVKKTNIIDYLSDENQILSFARLNRKFKYIITKAISLACELLSKEYDFEYDIDNDKYYCSELVYKVFVDKNDSPIFELQPMTFKDKYGKTSDFWIENFTKLGIPIPEGKLGNSPVSLSKSRKLKFLR